MSDLLERLATAREHAKPEPAGEDGLRKQWRRLEARRRRVRSQRALAVAAVALLAVGAVALWPKPEAQTVAETPVAPAPVEDDADLRFAEGSGVHFLTDDTHVIPEEVTEDRIHLSLQRGAARFDVTSGLSREFVVTIDDAEVAVVGTRFVVRRLAEEQVRIEVEEGRVRVRTPMADGEYSENVLSAGEAFETRTKAPELPEAPAEAAAQPTEPSESAERTRARPRPSSTWRALAEEGRFDEAYRALLQEDDLRNSDVGDLLLAADAARLSGHRDEAVNFLREVMQHPEDPRTSLGAFTLGRVLLRVRPSEAAEAFGFARRLDPDSSLAQDALAREVEAWYLAGRPGRARELAEEYVSRWPDGLRVDTVRRFGGLDSR